MAETLIHNEQAQRFELFEDGELAGFTEYHLSDRVATFDHTEVGPQFGGRGIGGRVVGFALAEVARSGEWRIRPVCPFVSAFLRRHPEYAGLVVT